MIGFGGAKSSGQEIISALNFCKENTCKDLVAEIFGIEEKIESPDPSLPDTDITQENTISSDDSNHENEDTNEANDNI